MRRRASVIATVAVVVLTLAAPARATPFPSVIVIPGATSAEGIASGAGTTFFAGDLFRGDIYRGDVRSGEASLFIDAPAGRNALGMKVDVAHGLLFVAGGFVGQAYVYNARTGADVAVFQLGTPGDGTIVNDVALANGAAWFTDSVHPRLFRVPIAADGSIGSPSTLTLTGPAAAITGAFNLNGIAATPDGKTLIVAHSSNGTLYTVNPTTGASAGIAGANTPFVDGILLETGRVWAVENFANQIVELRLSPDLSSATIQRTITSSAFEVPTTVARFGSRLAAVNAKFDTGFPPTATSYEVVVVDAR
jgi:sugar lactone lactonase YvrE